MGDAQGDEEQRPVMGAYFDLPPGRELAERNRRIIGERCGWPPRAVKRCEMIEAFHPDWYPVWSPGGTATRPRPGFYARRWQPERDEQPLYGADAAELATAIDEWKQAHPPQRQWPALRSGWATPE